MVRAVATCGLWGLALGPAAAAGQARLPAQWEQPGFDISPDGAWRVKARRVAAERRRLVGLRDFRALNAPAAAGPAGAVRVGGTMQVPLVLFYFRDTDPAAARDPAEYEALLFGTTPPAGRPYTLRSFYEQLSDGVFSMLGQAIGWAVLDSNEVTYTSGPLGGCTRNGSFCNGLFSSDAIRRMQNGLREALAKVDGGVDFGRFDNDGPDGVPNSGDDDGYVDMMGFAHATKDGSCGGTDHIWAHRFTLRNSTQSAYQDYVSGDASAAGGTIRVRDYFIQSGLGGETSCDDTQIMPIGTAAHEFGHALGLPDLYDVSAVTQGIGSWGLMGSGNFRSPNSPARMEAWSLSELGWVTVVPLAASATVGLGPAPSADTAFYIAPAGDNPRGEYYLVENRQRVLADTALIRIACAASGNPAGCGGGLMVWHADGAKLASGVGTNTVNVGTPPGLQLKQADGLNQLAGSSRGDAGDLYPGTSGQTALTLLTSPAATKNADGSYMGFDIDQITQVAPQGAMSFRLTFAGSGLTLGGVLARLFDAAATTLTAEQLQYLDFLGNANSQFDVGDFKAWVDAGAPAVPAPAPGAPGGRP